MLGRRKEQRVSLKHSRPSEIICAKMYLKSNKSKVLKMKGVNCAHFFVNLYEHADT